MHRFMRSVSLWTLALVALGSIHQANSTHSANNITYFTPERRHAVYVTEDAAGQLPLLPPEQDPIIRARNLAQVLYGLDDQDMVVKSNYTSVDTGITHVYLRQRWDDYEIINADMNINLDPQGLIVSYGSSFVPKQVDQPVAKDATLDQNPVRAVHAVVEALGYNSVSPTTMATEAQGDKTYYVTNVPGSVESATPVRKVYLINEESQLVPVWQVTLRTKDNWVVGHAVRQSASAAESASNDPKEQATLVSLISWRSDAVYNVYGLGEFDPLVGRRRFYKDPANQRSSPLGWHNNHRDQPFTTTQGNNVIAQQASTGEDWRFKERPNGGRDLVFNFPLNLSLEPRAYTDAAVVNTFYWVNILHDIFYLYGFDEKAGNFQQNNLHRGGLDNDPVIAYVQDHSE
ncbi:hypothetical protein H4R34_004108 [Dimargaris verticillata]|uniref:Extracellular metalloproteinase n=1 Tax=Dimargaris verticillata TaxID=2761393 RepID=A0A9W8ECJ0_9FUNG|nr:hypothetical protein H4R34_004108 [Dimargaris verticillata]